MKINNILKRILNGNVLFNIMNFVKENESRGKLDKDLDNISKTIKEELSKIVLPLLNENIDFKKTLLGHKFVQDILIEFNKTKMELDELKSRINKKNITLTISEKLEENNYVCGNVYDDVSLMLKQTSNDNVKKIPLDLDYDSILKEYDNDPEMQDNVPIGTSVMDDYWITMKKVSNISDQEESKAIQIWRTKNNDSTKSNNEIIVDIINKCGGIKKWLMMHEKESEKVQVIKKNNDDSEISIAPPKVSLSTFEENCNCSIRELIPHIPDYLYGIFTRAGTELREEAEKIANFVVEDKTNDSCLAQLLWRFSNIDVRDVDDYEYLDGFSSDLIYRSLNNGLKALKCMGVPDDLVGLMNDDNFEKYMRHYGGYWFGLDENGNVCESEESAEPVVQETTVESEEESVETVVEETVAESEEESVETVVEETVAESEEESAEPVVQETTSESEEEAEETVVQETVAESEEEDKTQENNVVVEETADESEEESDETVVEETTVESEEDSEESVVEETAVESEEAGKHKKMMKLRRLLKRVKLPMRSL